MNKTIHRQDAKSAKAELEKALCVDPFSADFGAPGDRNLKDKIVKARKPRECDHCREMIQTGSLIRSRTDIFDDEIQSYQWCQSCTELMAHMHDDDDDTAEDKFDARHWRNSAKLKEEGTPFSAPVPSPEKHQASTPTNAPSAASPPWITPLKKFGISCAEACRHLAKFPHPPDP